MVITGFDPLAAEDEPELGELVYRLRPNSAFIFSIQEQLLQQPPRELAEYMHEGGPLTVFAESLESQDLKTGFAMADEDDEYQAPGDDLDTTFIYANNTRIKLDNNLLFETQGIAKLLSETELGDLHVPAYLRKEFFYKFLKESVSEPQWYGYANDFNFRRHFEEELEKKVKRALDKKSHNSQIVLVGQTCASKSIALTSLAFHVYQEMQYPVVFISRRNATLENGGRDVEALKNLLYNLEKKGAGSVLLIWDNASSFTNPVNEAKQLHRDLHQGAGRRVVLVSSSYPGQMPRGKGGLSNIETVETGIDLVNNEPDRLRSFVLNAGVISAGSYDEVIKLSYGKNLLFLLYRLFERFFEKLSPSDILGQGVHEEAHKSLTADKLLDLEEDFVRKQARNALGIMAAAFKKGRLPDGLNAEKDHDESLKQAGEQLRKLLRLLAVSSQFAVDLPLSLALRTAGLKDENLDFTDLCRMLAHTSILRLTERSGEDNSGYQMTIGFRTPLEAKLYLDKLEQFSPNDEIALVVDLIAALSEDNDISYVKAVDRLVRAIGPNSPCQDDWQKRKLEQFRQPADNNPESPRKRPYESIIDALAKLRKRLGDESYIPRLLLQEVTWKREVYGKNIYGNNQYAEKAKEELTDAIQIAKKAFTKLAGSTDEKICRNNLLVEMAHSEARLYDCLNAKTNKSNQPETLRPFLNDFGWYFKELCQIAGDQTNTYPVNALCKLFIRFFEHDATDAETTPNKSKILNDMSDLFDGLDVNLYEEDNEEFAGYKLKILGYLNNEKVDKYISELIKKNDPVGIHLRFKQMLSKHGLDLKSKFSEDQRHILEELIDFLEKHRVLTEKYAGCLYSLLFLKWQQLTGKVMFGEGGAGKEFTSLKHDDWSYISQLCECFHKTPRKFPPNEAKVLYIHALSEAQRGNFKASEDLFKKIKKIQDLNIFSYNYRVYTWYIICDERGIPKRFSVPQITAPTEVGKLKRHFDLPNSNGEHVKVFYTPSNLKLERHELAWKRDDIELGLNFIGFVAYRELEKGRSES